MKIFFLNKYYIADEAII